MFADTSIKSMNRKYPSVGGRRITICYDLNPIPDDDETVQYYEIESIHGAVITVGGQYNGRTVTAIYAKRASNRITIKCGKMIKYVKRSGMASLSKLCNKKLN